MKLTCEATLDDVVEPSFRLFLRSKTYVTNRWRDSAIWAGIFALFAYLGFHSNPNVNIVWVCAAASIWGAVIHLLTYKGTVRRRIQKYVEREMKGPWPRTSDYEITTDKVIYTGSGVSTSFNLTDLTGIVEDAKRLELTFGDKGLCLVPLRAFQSTEEKAEFLAQIQHPATPPQQ